MIFKQLLLKPSFMKKLIFFTFLFICLSFTSCSTLFTGTKQTVQISSKPPGAKIQVNGIDRGRTPNAVSLKKGNDGQLITLTLEGYEPRTFQSETTFNTISILNLFNPFFWLVDLVSGAAWKYDPSFMEVELEPVKSKD